MSHNDTNVNNNNVNNEISLNKINLKKNLNLKIIHWNCNSLWGKTDTLNLLIEKHKPDIISINETKLSKEKEEYLEKNKNYEYHFKSRKDGGGGVAILIKKTISHDNYEIETNAEIKAIKVHCKQISILIASYYNPPTVFLDDDLIYKLSTENSNFILCGDLNAKLKIFGNSEDNSNGHILERILTNTNLIVANGNEHTYEKYNSEYKEKLDLIICSQNAMQELVKCKVLVNSDYGSDHLPIIAKFQFEKIMLPEEEIITKNYKTAKWKNYKIIVDENIDKLNNLNEINDINYLNEIITSIFLDADSKIIKAKKISNKTKLLPADILELLKIKRSIRRKFNKNKDESIKQKYNELNKIVKEEIIAYRNKKWKEFVDKQGKNPLSSAPFWKRINYLKKNKTKISTKSMPKLVKNNITYNTDEEKCNLFSNILKETFSESKCPNYDNKHKLKVEKEVKNFLDTNKKSENVDLFTMEELNYCLKSLKCKPSSGIDGINNFHLKNSTIKMKELLLLLYNKTLMEGKIPLNWKKTIITMIPKKNDDKNDPKNYRPISLTSCIAKLGEKLMSIRIKEHLRKNKIIIKQQSGFRQHRQTKDNLIHLTQKILESFNRQKKVLAIFFDISQAFDKVWHDGIIYKLINHNFPSYIINWIKDFLDNRSFCVKIGKCLSLNQCITSGVPQGAVLSPILFSIYINDITTEYKKNLNYSIMFADDLVNYYIYNKPGKVKALVQNYLLNLEKWLNKWRLSMSAPKCNYIIFSKSTKSEDDFKLKLYNEPITKATTVKFLGIIFDNRLNFDEHLNEMLRKCHSRVNMIKLLSHKYWQLKKDTLKCIYISLIRSIIDYSSFIIPIINQANYNRVKAIQNRSLKSIYKLPRLMSTVEVCQHTNMLQIIERAHELNSRYLLNSILNKNPLIIDLLQDYKRFKNKEDNYNTIIYYYFNEIKDWLEEEAVNIEGNLFIDDLFIQ